MTNIDQSLALKALKPATEDAHFGSAIRGTTGSERTLRLHSRYEFAKVVDFRIGNFVISSKDQRLKNYRQIVVT